MAITDATKLELFNGALTEYLGEREIADLTVSDESRRVLDRIWNAGGLVNYALERGGWNFAMRSQELDYNSAVEPGFGFSRAFTVPADLVRLESLAATDDFALPLTDREYVEEAGFWFADCDVLYVKFVSNDPDYGHESSRWTGSFKEYLKVRLARKACLRITSSESMMRDLVRVEDLALSAALSTDAMRQGVKFPPAGSWRRAAQSGYDSRRNPTRLIG